MANHAARKTDAIITAATIKSGYPHSILLNQSNPSHLSAVVMPMILTATNIKAGNIIKLYQTSPVQLRSWKIHKKLSMVY